MKLLKTGLLTLTSLIFSYISFSQAPTANGNVMNFSSTASYESYTDDESTWNGLRNIAEQSSTLTTLAEQEASTATKVNDVDTLYPEFLKEVLNTDNIFQMGNYLIKIDLINDRGLMIASSNANAYSSLVNDNLSATGMMVLSGDEDFGLELLESLESNTTKPADYQSFLVKMSCSGAKRVKPDADKPMWIETNEQCDIVNTYTIGKTYRMDNKLVYRKSIFYFSLRSEIRSIWHCTFGGTPNTAASIYVYVDLKLTGTVKYRRHCGTEVNESVNLFEGYFGGGDGILNWRPYGGGRSLSHFDFNVDFGIRATQDRTPNPQPYIPSRRYRIFYGY